MTILSAHEVFHYCGKKNFRQIILGLFFVPCFRPDPLLFQSRFMRQLREEKVEQKSVVKEFIKYTCVSSMCWL